MIVRTKKLPLVSLTMFSYATKSLNIQEYKRKEK